MALKILPDEVSKDAERRARFDSEAKAVAALSHPNILAIHDFGDHDGTAYAVMELLEGQTLRRLSGGALPARKAGEIGAQIAYGLAAAQEKGIVHRENHKGILIGRGGAMLKTVGTLARQEIEAFLGTKVYLGLFVKVQERWRETLEVLQEMGLLGSREEE